MTFFDCVSDALDEGSIDKSRAERAQEYWRTFRDRHVRNGHSEEMADALAGEDVKAAFRKEFGKERQAFIQTRIAMRNSEALVENAVDLVGLPTDRVEFRPNSRNRVSPIAQQADGLYQRVKGRMNDLAEYYGPKQLTGKSKDPAGVDQVAKEMMGQPTGNPRAAMVARVVSETIEDLRRMANEAGANIGKIDNYMPTRHDRMAVAKAGFDQWFETIAPKLDWHRIEDFLTGRPMAPEGGEPPIETQREFLREIFNNMAFGKDSDKPQYARISGENIVKAMSHERVLQFKSAEDWIEYNTAFGTGDVFSAIMDHTRSMSEDIVTLRELGQSWRLGLDYERQVAVKKARDMGDEKLAGKVEAAYDNAEIMLAIRRGGAAPKSWRQANRASWYSSARSWITASLLERAVIPSISDLNSNRLAAQTFGANPLAPFAQAMKFMFDSASRQDLQRMGRALDHMFQTNSVAARFNAEAPPHGFVNNVTNSVFRYTGLSGLTDHGRNAIKHVWHGRMADFQGQSLKDVDPGFRELLVRRGITEEDWAEFSKPGVEWRDESGAPYLDAVYWREKTDLDPSRADDIFLKFEGLSEEFSEMGVPSQSLFAQAQTLGRIGLDRPKGDFGYEFAKSVGMFKSFLSAFTVNQYRAIMGTESWRMFGFLPEAKGRAARVARFADSLTFYTLLGGLALQITNVNNGQDPEDMSDPDFWWRATLKGGGLGFFGDLLNISGGKDIPGAIGSFVVGPVGDLAVDMGQLTIGNGAELLANAYRLTNETDTKPTGLGGEVVDFIDDWTPNDFPVVGTVIDRLMMDNLKAILDPEGVDDIAAAARNRENRTGSKFWWTPGKAAPERAPDLGAAFGR
jgi:hypothetical protein